MSVNGFCLYRATLYYVGSVDSPLRLTVLEYFFEFELGSYEECENCLGKIDCKTVGFFSKSVIKEIGKAWRKSFTRAKRVRREKFLVSLPSLAFCFHPRSRPFV